MTWTCEIDLDYLQLPGFCEKQAEEFVKTAASLSLFFISCVKKSVNIDIKNNWF